MLNQYRAKRRFYFISAIMFICFLVALRDAPSETWLTTSFIVLSMMCLGICSFQVGFYNRVVRDTKTSILMEEQRDKIYAALIEKGYAGSKEDFIKAQSNMSSQDVAMLFSEIKTEEARAKATERTSKNE